MSYPSDAVKDAPISNEVRRVIDEYMGAVEITPDDSNNLTAMVRGLIVGAAGNVKLTTIAGDTVTVYMLAGYLYRIVTTKVFATGTAATGIVGLY